MLTRRVLNLSGSIATGDANHFGTNDIDYINNYLTGAVQSSDPVTINTNTTFGSGNLICTSPSISGSGGLLTLPVGPDTVVGRATTDTLTNKTADGELNTLINMRALASYTFYVSGSTYKYRDWKLGTTTSNSDFSTLINSLITGNGATGGVFYFLGQNFVVNSPILIPTGAPNSTSPFIFHGVPGANRQTNCTTFTVGAGMSDQTYMVDGTTGITAGSAKDCSTIHINSIFFFNPTPYLGGTVSSTNKNIGGVVIASDNINGAGTNRRCMLEHLWFQYMWRCVHLKGAIYRPILNDIWSEDLLSSGTGSGDVDIKIEKSGLSDVCKFGSFSNLRANHSAFWTMSNWLYSDAGYSSFTHLKLDGTTYTEAPLKCQGATNYWSDVILLDQNGVPSPDNRVAAFLFDGTGAYDNHVTWSRAGMAAGTANPKIVSFRNGAFRNSVQLGYFGQAVSIDDSSAGIENVVYIFTGAMSPSSIANTKIASTNGTVRIIDERKGAKNGGTATATGTGSATTFTIAHGLFAAPSNVSVTPNNLASKYDWITKDSTNITINYSVAPSNATALSWFWMTDVYP